LSARLGVVQDSGRTAAQYDSAAESYALHNQGSPFNAYYERPATVDLIGDAFGKRVLEVGCGAGSLTDWMVDQGAIVTATDVSEVMLGLARARLGNRARIVLADLAAPMTFASDASFDLVVASLVLHYVRNWEGPLREFRRLLVSDGAVVFSTHHPTMDARLHSPDDYFALKQVTEVWDLGSSEFEVSFWRRPLTDMTEAIHRAGFAIERLVEPEPLRELEERDPDAYGRIRTQPAFLFFRLRCSAPPGC
jgi:SAM-dependent methyltransferase